MRADVRFWSGAVVRPAWGRVRAVSASMLVLAALAGSPVVRAQDEAPSPEPAGPEALLPSDEAPEAEAPASSEPETVEAEPEATTEEPATAMAAAAGTASDDPATQLLSLPVLANAPAPASFNGSYTTEVPIQVPEFRGIEPKLSLVYDSSQGLKAGGMYGGFVGTGWRLTGFPEVIRVSAVKGVAGLHESDVYVLDGQELIRCAAPWWDWAPSCQAGGEYATRIESYRKITFDETTNRWLVQDPDGTLWVYSHVQVGTMAAAAAAAAPEASAAPSAIGDTAETSAALDETPESPPVEETEPEVLVEAGPEVGVEPEPGAGDDPTLAEVPEDPPAGEDAWVVEDDLVVPDQTDPVDEEGNVTEAQPEAARTLTLAASAAVAQSEQDLANTRYRWLLTLVKDTNGNQVDYSYWCPSAPVCWPDAVTYNGVKIQFLRTAGTTQTRAVGNGLAKLDQRLAQIDIYASGYIQRSYQLQTEPSKTTGLARLVSIKQVGTNAIARGALAPLEWRFTYSDPSIWFESDTSGGGVVQPDGGVNATYADLNGDARQDVLVVSSSLDKNDLDDPEDNVLHCGLKVYLSIRQWDGPQLKDKLVAAPAPPIEGDDNACDPGDKDSGNFSFRTGDFNGDGKADIAHISSQWIFVYLSYWESGLKYTPAYRLKIADTEDYCPLNYPDCQPSDRVDGGEVVLADVDGDGRVEIIVTAGNNGAPHPFTKRKVWYWTSGGFASTPIDLNIGGYDRVIATADLNGNGRQELVFSSRALGDTDSEVLEHRTGSRFYMERTANNVMDGDWQFVGTQGDFNGDGATDLARLFGGRTRGQHS